MNLQQRKALLVRLRNYMSAHEESWEAAKEKATGENPWFIPEFIQLSVDNIVRNFLSDDQLGSVVSRYRIPEENTSPKTTGIVMAGNIPLVGFHDLLCVFICGHFARLKPSSKDSVLITHLVEVMTKWDKEAANYLAICERIPSCEVYIATGSNNTARYFEYYFQKYPHLIRKNRTSVAVLKGNETPDLLEKLADDVYLFFGLGCRNVTKIFVPENYDFIDLLTAFKKYDFLADHNKYKNNYDYNLAVHILNNQFYMSTPALILVKDESVFSRISQLNYGFYTNENELLEYLKQNEQVQCIVGNNYVPFGKAQSPGITDYADGVDTIKFLMDLQLTDFNYAAIY